MKITLIGTGLMGFPVCMTLLDSGYDLTVYNRTSEKAEPLTEYGANIARSPRDAVASSPGTILMLTDASAIDGILFADPGVDLMGKTILQMGTIAPEESRSFEARVSDRGGSYFEAPVLDNKHHARQGDLIVMGGGSEVLFNQWKPVFDCLGSHIRYVGPTGSAAALKLALNHLIAALTASFGLSLKLVENNNVSTDMFMDILRNSALYAEQFDKKLDRIRNHDYSDPNFPTEHLLKDVKLVLRSAQEAALETSALEGIIRIVQNAIDRGFGGTDYSSLVKGISHG